MKNANAMVKKADVTSELVTQESQHAKQSLMKKILESSDKGRGILDLARSLAKEIDLVAPSSKQPQSAPTATEEELAGHDE